MDKLMNLDGNEEPVVVTIAGRKRRPSKECHHRERVKKMRHSGGGKVPVIACSHTSIDMHTDACQCCADRLTPDDITHNFNLFYDKPNKVEQDQALLLLMEISEVKRRRKPQAVVSVDEAKKTKDRNVTVKYSLLAGDHPNKLPVCKATFLKVLGVSKDRVSRVARYYAEHAKPRPENRGGARKVDENKVKTDQIKDHVQTFTCRASHYGRRGAPGRKYLPSDLSVMKMYQLFENQNHQDISYSLYYSVFRYNFNLGFGHPATDACAICAKYRLKIKDPDMTDEDKRFEAATFILHRRRARCFYDMLGLVVNDSVTVCFDMMQNLVLPRTPIGQAYYSRQLYMYLFGVVVHHGKDSGQAKDDVHLYTWMEHENKKDSNMISSALNHCFRRQLNGPLRQVSQLRMFSDSCYGQNKNINVMSMIFALRKQAFPNLNVEYVFPIRGHSFLPADRVFGRIEQGIRKHDTILMPEEYYNILKRHGNVYVYGVDWNAFDFKAATSKFVKTQKSFKISEARMLNANSDQIGFKATYSGEYSYHSVLKRGMKWADFKPAELPHQTTVKEAKKQDVRSLLFEIGANNNVQQFYEDAFAATTENDAVISEEE